MVEVRVVGVLKSITKNTDQCLYNKTVELSQFAYWHILRTESIYHRRYTYKYR